MPDTKLTWANLRENLRKNLFIYIVAIAAAMFLTDLLWTSTTPRVPEDQRVLVYLADGYSNPDAMADIAADMLARARTEDETLEQVEFEGLLYTGEGNDYTGVVLMMTRLAAAEGDAFLCNEPAMQTLVQSRAALPLDDYYANGWLADSGLEPFYATLVDEETGASETLLAGFRIDSLDALYDLGAMNNEGAYLAIAINGTNVETTMRAVEIMVDDLRSGVRADD